MQSAALYGAYNVYVLSLIPCDCRYLLNIPAQLSAMTAGKLVSHPLARESSIFRIHLATPLVDAPPPRLPSKSEIVA